MARAENDRWDLKSSVGATATMVAAQRALAHRDKLIDDPFAEPLVRAAGHHYSIRLVDGSIESQEDPESTVRRSVDAITVRTRFFDRLFNDAAASGVRQAVILAAGLDTRAYRLWWPKETVVFELDQPAVIDFKTATLADLHVKPRAVQRAIGIDLRDDWPKALLDNAFDRSKATAWIAEGLLIYLPPEALGRLFENVTELSGPGSTMATEYVPDMSVFFGARAQSVAEQMKKSGHDLDVADLIYHGERSHVIEHLGRLGWQVSSQTSKELLEADGFSYPDDEDAVPFGNANYVTAMLL
ncbi:class I SAM-dependent methyltransferase [Mycobacterium sp. SMC-2]|uniref:class I SAM-dependent methyltransferase n=1 Tax=Mycobacterium sp. SMC-2 TaxID=2857058 RepID=UPI0021B47585|nr:class I SAM-dependent methyltransferase [Mycobacterium sp. SMC-2]UXA05332.1 class I SAM-dependent methyltransferase [Mycobacterium sp. SMC-2]